MSQTYYLPLLENYQCLADQCPDNCCHRWNIDVDPPTLKKWQSIKDNNRRQFILDACTTLNSSNNSEYNIRQKPDGNCVHADESGLCCIQRDFGHDFLPATCQEYPRTTIERQHIALKTAHLSCPAIVNLLTDVQQETLLVFEEGLYSKTGDDIINQFSLALHKYISQLIKTKKYRPGLSLYLVSNLIGEIMSQASSNILSQESLQTSFQERCSQIENDINLWEQITAEQLQEDMDSITDFLKVFHSGLLSKYQSTLEEKFNIDLTPVTLDEIQAYQKTHNLIDYNKLLANYLHVKFINHGFPWNPFRNNHAASFFDSVFPYIILNIILIRIHASGVDMSTELVLKTIYSVEKLNSHNFDNFDLLGSNPQLLNIRNYNKLFILLA